MTLPDGVQTCTVTLSVPLDTFGNPAKAFTGKVRTDRDLIWAETGEVIWRVETPMPDPVDGRITFEVPLVDQPGMLGSDGVPITNWSYRSTTTATWAQDRRSSSKTFQVFADTPPPLDLDLVPDGAPVPPVEPGDPYVVSLAGQSGAITTPALAGILDGVTAAQITTPGSDTATALDGRVVEILSDDPSVVAAAEAAVGDAADGLDVALRSDPGMPAVSDSDIYAEFVDDEAGNIAQGIEKSGDSYFARIKAKYINGSPAEVLETFPSDYARVGVDSNGWISELDATDNNGKAPAWVLRNWRSRSSKALLGVASFGDSMTAGYKGDGSSYPGVMGTLVPVPVTNNGITSQTSSEVALRQGGLDVYVTVSGSQIPTSGAVSATVLPAGTWRAGTAWTFTGTLAGVPGTLAKDAAGAWTFTRTTAGDAVSCPAETLWQSAQAVGPLVGQIHWAGRNNVTDHDTILRDIDAMLTAARRLGAPVLVLPIFNQRTETSGGSTYNAIMTTNAALASLAGPDFYDLRGWLIRNGLAEMAITPTGQDTTDIGNDCIPQSLMDADNMHLNAAGYTAIGRRLARLTTSKGWYAA